MKKTAPGKFPTFSKELCVACTTCVNICPAGALELQIMNSIHGFRRYPYLQTNKKCIGCERCENECPTGAVTINAN